MGLALEGLVEDPGGRLAVSMLWGGRFESDPAEALWELTVSTPVDRALLKEDCAVLLEHARRLQAAGLISSRDLADASQVLSAISDEDPTRIVDASDEDIHSTVERLLLQALPQVAGKLRAGLSRNDRVASAFRRAVLSRAEARGSQVIGLASALHRLAAKHAADPIPGYTHLQRAQPVTIGHQLLAHAWPLLRDASRLRDAVARASKDPLGAGALAGSTLNLPAVAEPMENSLDAVSARDHVMEVLAAYAICGVHLSRLCEEVILWTSSEFGFAELDDAWATGSSLMPQKKNPDVAELTRGKTGRLIGNLNALLITIKGLPLSYNRDLQEDKPPFFDSDETLRLCLAAMTGLVSTMSFRTEACRAAAEDPMLYATDVADALVEAGVDFRDAHRIVGEAVRLATHAEDVEAAFADALAEHLPADRVRACFDVDTAIARRTGNGPGSVQDQLAAMQTLLS